MRTAYLLRLARPSPPMGLCVAPFLTRKPPASGCQAFARHSERSHSGLRSIPDAQNSGDMYRVQTVVNASFGELWAPDRR